MKVYIVDDEEQARTTLSYYLGEFFTEVEILGFASNVTDAAKEIRQLKPEMIFLDISMPGGNGFDLFNQLDTTQSLFVFVSAHKEFVFDAIKINVFDYLLKPLQVNELSRVITKARIALQKNPREKEKVVTDSIGKVFIKADHKVVIYDAEEILYVNSDGNYSTVYLSSGKKIVLSKNIKKVEEDMFSGFPFFRVHQSNIINLRKVREYNAQSVMLEHGQEIPIARSKYDLFRIALNQI